MSHVRLAQMSPQGSVLSQRRWLSRVPQPRLRLRYLAGMPRAHALVARSTAASSAGGHAAESDTAAQQLGTTEPLRRRARLGAALMRGRSSGPAARNEKKPYVN